MPISIMRSTVVTAFFSLMLSFGAADAASPWPASVVGTWDMSANQSTLVLTITKQVHVAGCSNISGTLVDTVTGRSDIQGFYCVGSGRIGFLRKDHNTGLTFQAFTGNLSVAGSPTHMAGQFAQETGGPSANAGEFDFFCTER